MWWYLRIRIWKCEPVDKVIPSMRVCTQHSSGHTYRCNKNVSAIFLCRMPPWSTIKKLKSSNRNLWLSYRYSCTLNTAI